MNIESDCEKCPLCGSRGPFDSVEGADQRDYRLCGECRLIFVPPADRLGPAAEKARYATHRNSIEDAGYCRFLNRLLEPMLKFLDPGMRGLDYGCGPGPTLSRLAARAGLECDDYDPLFRDMELEPPYDFIFSTECFEHFSSPWNELERIVQILRPGGSLGIMTELWQSIPAFADWHYTRDPTHIAFYHRDTIDWIAANFGLELLWTDEERCFVFAAGS